MGEICFMIFSFIKMEKEKKKRGEKIGTKIIPFDIILVLLYNVGICFLNVEAVVFVMYYFVLIPDRRAGRVRQPVAIKRVNDIPGRVRMRKTELTVSISPASTPCTLTPSSLRSFPKAFSPDEWISPLSEPNRSFDNDDLNIAIPPILSIAQQRFDRLATPVATVPDLQSPIAHSDSTKSELAYQVSVKHITTLIICVVAYDAVLLMHGLLDGKLLLFIAEMVHIGICGIFLACILSGVEGNTSVVLTSIETIINCHVIAHHEHLGFFCYVPAIAMLIPVCLVGCSVKSHETIPPSARECDTNYLEQPTGKHSICFLYLSQVLSLCVIVSMAITMFSFGGPTVSVPNWVELLCMIVTIAPIGLMFHILIQSTTTYRDSRVSIHNQLNCSPTGGILNRSWTTPPVRLVWDSPTIKRQEDVVSQTTTIHSHVHSVILSVNTTDIEKSQGSESTKDSKKESIVTSFNDNDSASSCKSMRSDPGRWREQKNLRFDKEQKREPAPVTVSKLPFLGTKLVGRRKSFSFRNIEWRKGDILGRGGFGSVFIGLNEATGQLMAVKSLQFDVKDRTIIAKTKLLQNEIALMKTLEHPNIVSYYFTERVGNSINIFMEYVPGGSLLQVINQFGALGDMVSSAYAEQILYGLSYLHSQSVVHRDIKCANVLVSTDGVCKLADFGSAIHISKILPKDQVGIQGTPVWMAPEVITEQGHDWRCDIWSLGCTVIEMLTGQPPFTHYNTTPIQTMQEVITKPIRLPDVGKLVRHFLKLCLNKTSDLRPSAEELLGHGWIRDCYECESGSSIPNTPRKSDTTIASSHLSPQAETLSASSGNTWSSKGSTRYSESMKGKPLKCISEKDSNTLMVRKLQAVKIDIEKRASLMQAKKACANVLMKKAEIMLSTNPEGVEDSPMLKIMLGEQRDETEDNSVFCLPPKFHHAILTNREDTVTQVSSWAPDMSPRVYYF